MNFNRYAVLSTVSATGVMGYAYLTRTQFYPAVVFLVTSKPALVVMGNMALLLTLLFGRFTKRVFLGRLREAELEIVRDNVRYAATETCLALTVFREEPTTRVIICFTALLFSKVFHWLCDTRVEHVEQAQETSRLSHIRISALMICLFMTDITLTATSIYNVQKNGPSVELLLGFEYAVLSITIATTFVRYCLSIIDMHFVHGRWHNKSLYELYLRLLTDSIQLLIYLVFFSIVFTYYTLPLHLMRQLYMSFRNVYDRMSHFLRFRRVTSNLHERFGNATAEELEATDKVCIICREEMEASEGFGGPKRLQCGHIFHFYCLRTWLERQLSCPTCRANIPTTAQPPINPAAAAAEQRAQPQPIAQDQPQAEADAPGQAAVPQAEQVQRNLPAVEQPAQQPVEQAQPRLPGAGTDARLRMERESARQHAQEQGALAALRRAQSSEQDRSQSTQVAETAGSASAADQTPREADPTTHVSNPSNSTPVQDSPVSQATAGVGDQNTSTSTRPVQQLPTHLPSSQVGQNHLPTLHPFSTGTTSSTPILPGGIGSISGLSGGIGDIPGFSLPELGPSSFALGGTGIHAPVMAPSVAQVLQQRIEMLQLHLQVYQAQTEAANACHAAAVAAMQAAELLPTRDVPASQDATAQQRDMKQESSVQQHDSLPQGTTVKREEEEKNPGSNELRQRHSLDRNLEN